MSFICPICKKILTRVQNTRRCENNHCFDIAKEGYVNLAPSRSAGASSGDSKQMCLDRRLFLESGFYGVLARAIALSVSDYSECGTLSIVDAGCGEGYYLRQMRSLLGSENRYFGIDLAKEAIRLASKSEKLFEEHERINYAVGGIFDLPFESGFADVIISVFAPISEGEFLRVLKDGGLLIVACPGENHLYGLKSALYETAKENEEKIPEYESYELVDVRRETYSITVEGELISALFGMTPYYWKSSRDVQEKARGLKKVETPCDFIIKVYRKSV